MAATFGTFKATSGASAKALAFALALLGLAVLPTSTLASPVEVTLVSTLDGRQHVSGLALEPLSLAELGVDARVAMQQTSRARAHAGSGSLGVSGDSGLQVSALPSFIERELPIRWRVRLAPDQSPADLRIEAEWSSPIGEPGRVAVDGRQVGGPPVRVQVEGPWLLFADERGQVYEGALTVRIPLEALSRAGALEGRVHIQGWMP